ncbi:MAG TPA: HlyD family efflux transporter periplasmic adaptor subunit [Candidatus Saccharimonadales bacterium]|nr:HlyD family efflux transporter periplasmic adaptor subunit [Candidatus Saccharimonadales bacterium]
MIPKPARIAIPLAVLAAVIAFVVLHHRNGREALVASGTVEATDAQLGFQVPGRIESIQVHEGDAVRAGQELAMLDRAETRARREQAAAQAAAARAGLEELERGYRSEEVAQARDAFDAARRRLADARDDLSRASRLRESGAVSQQSLDKAQVAADVAQSQFQQAREQLQLMESGPRRERVDAQRAQWAQAEAAVRAMDATLANMVVLAPFDGVVTVRHREPGEIVAAGSPVVTVMNPEDRWVRIFVREDRLGAVHLGQAAAVTSDTYPGRKYSGAVTFIASEAEFTPKSVQTAEERVKLVYAVKVRISGDPAHELKPGIPADVRLELDRK